jgi:hypothetical protein
MMFLPYVLLPITLVCIWKIWELPFPGLTFLITLFLIALYPFVLFRLDEYYHPYEQEQPQCGMFAAPIIFVNYVLMIPLTLAFQLILNFIFLRKKITHS